MPLKLDYWMRKYVAWLTSEWYTSTFTLRSAWSDAYLHYMANEQGYFSVALGGDGSMEVTNLGSTGAWTCMLYRSNYITPSVPIDKNVEACVKYRIEFELSPGAVANPRAKIGLAFGAPTAADSAPNRTLVTKCGVYFDTYTNTFKIGWGATAPGNWLTAEESPQIPGVSLSVHHIMDIAVFAVKGVYTYIRCEVVMDGALVYSSSGLMYDITNDDLAQFWQEIRPFLTISLNQGKVRWYADVINKSG